MKILTVGFSDTHGGSSKAMFRIVGHLRDQGHDVRMLVAQKRSNAPFVDGPLGAWPKILSGARRYAARAIIAMATGSRAPDRTLGLLPGGLAARINASDADVVLLGWLGEETMSIGEIAAIEKPLAWRFSDMWAMAGTEHCVDEAAFVRYSLIGHSTTEQAFDLDALVFRRKRREWKMTPTVIAPGQWMADCVASSAIGHNWPVSVVPTPVATETFCPANRTAARAKLGLPIDRRLLIFSAINADRDRNKGWDILVEALNHVEPERHACVVVGRMPGSAPLTCPIRVIDTGCISDERKLASLYAAADVTVIPSRIDNLPQVGLEAQACGCPVVAFDIPSMRDLVDDGITGKLAKPYSAEDLALAILHVLDGDRNLQISKAARVRAVALWSPSCTVPLLVAALESARKRHAESKARQ